MLVVLTGAVPLVRFRPLWACFSLEQWYAPPLRPTPARKLNQ
ncbi:hypothetical protein [Leptodesmis sp.]